MSRKSLYNTASLRHTSQNNELPWMGRLVTLIRITPDGTVTQATSESDKRMMLGDAGDSDLLLVAWPGQWRQDVFVVDDLGAARLSAGLPRHRTATTPTARPTLDFSDPARVERVDLWGRLAAVADLPLEGQLELARHVSANGWVVEPIVYLFNRPDLDPEARELLLANASERHARALISEGCAKGEAVALLNRFTDDADVTEAALQRSDLEADVLQYLAGLDYDQAARRWQQAQSWNSKQRPALAKALLSSLLESEPVNPPANTGYGPDRRHDRLALLQSVLAQLSVADRIGALQHPQHGLLAQQGLLTNDELADDELMACLPAITRPLTSLPSDGVPLLANYLLRFPRLQMLAAEPLSTAASRLIVDGWDPVDAARSGNWEALTVIADVAGSVELVDALLGASIFDSIGRGGQRWHDPKRYAFLDALLENPAASEQRLREVLHKLHLLDLEEIVQSTPNRSRIHHLAGKELRTRRPLTGNGAVPRPCQTVVLPTDEELVGEADPVASLRQLLKTRNEEAVDYALSSSFMTDELAWTLPVKVIERHPVYGPKLAAKVAELCGSSPVRWQVFASSWSQPTQLLANSLFKRIRSAEI